MKNTILKMAGVKNPEALYKKYATEADFLKAHPEAKTQLEKFALGGIDANRQTYAKTIIYSPEEWHQKNILAGNVMLGKKNDLKTMFKNNIYPQYTLPNDTVPINYSPVVKQLPMPQGFVDKNKGVFNYAAGQQLPKQANGGQMNAQAVQQFAGGGQIGKNIGAGLYGAGEGLLDTLTFGATDQLTDMGYKALQKAGGSTEDEIREQDSIAGYAKAAGAITGGVMNPTALKNSIIETAEGVGQGVSKGSESEEWARTTGQVINAVAPIASMASGSFGGSGGAKSAMKTGITTNAGNSSGNFLNPSNMMGQTQFGYAKYGGMQQYAMGGMNVQPNAEAENDELVTTNTPPQVVSGGEVNMVSNNPYGTPDYAINGNNHGEGENGGGVKMNVASGSVFKGKLKNPLTGNLFKKDFKKISFQENMFTKKLENGDAYAQNTANLILPVLAKTKEDMEMYQQAILDNKKQAKDLRAGIMPGQSQGKMAIGKYGGMMNYMAMGGIQKSDYQTDPGKLPSLLRQQKANDATILGMRSSFGRNADTNNVEDPLVVTFNKAKNYGKELADKIKNHPEFKKEMGGKLPMYYMGGDNDPEPDQPYTGTNYKDFDEANYFPQGNYNNYDYLHENNTPENHTAQSFIKKFNDNYVAKPLTALQKLNSPIQFSSTTKVDPKINTKGKGFDWANVGKQVGQYALQNAGNIYDLYRSTQDNSKLNLARYSPELLSAEKSLFDNQRMYSEGKRQTAEASGGNASTYLGNLGALRGQKMAADLDTRVQFGNINAQIANAAKLYNAGAIDKETMFKLQSEGANRDMFASGLKGVSQNIINQQNTNRKFASEDELFKAVKGDFSLYFRIKEAQRLAEEKAKGELS